MLRQKILKEVRELALIAGGSFVMSVGFVLFLIPNKIAPGGVSGLATVLHYLIYVPVGLTMLVFNIPIFLLGVKLLGRKFGVRTIIGTVLLSFFIDFMFYYIKLPRVTDNRLLASLYGGVFLGAGIGLVFRGRGSTGGSDIIGKIIGKYTNFTTGMGIMFCDFIVITFAGVAFKSIELALYAYVALYLSSRVIDLILEGWSYARGAYIISDKSERIAERLLKDMNRGVTALHGKGMFGKQDREVLFCVFTRRELSHLKEIIKDVDSDAFVIITKIHEVFGEGFHRKW